MLAKTIVVIGSILVVMACSGEPKPYADYEWDPEIESLKGGALQDWIAKAPFSGKWDPSKTNEKGTFVITNESQVFPFMGKYQKEDGPLNEKEDIYQKTRLFFRDKSVTEALVHATLLTHSEPVYLESSYSEMGNVAFSGVNSIYENYTAGLSETMVFEDSNEYKTGLYWVANGNGSYFLGFYQKKNLVLEVAFPCKRENKEYAASKIKEVNAALELNIPEWQEVKPDQLVINEKPLSFWQDPYLELFPNKRYFVLGDLRIKIKNTPFKKVSPSDKEIDYEFSYDGPKGEVKLSLSKNETQLSESDYIAQQDAASDSKSILEYSHSYEKSRKVYSTVSEKEGRFYSRGETYFKDNSILKIDYSYPLGDIEAKRTIENMLLKLKIKNVI